MELNPPPIIDSCRVIEFSINDESVTFTDRINLFISTDEKGKWNRLGEMPYLAICKPYNAVCEYFLFLCNENWEPQGTIGRSSIEDAKTSAENGYSGISVKWKNAPYSEHEVEQYIREVYGVDPTTNWWETRCSFCDKLDHEVTNIFRAEKACICFECIENFYALTKE